jgi:hypothetical protein
MWWVVFLASRMFPLLRQTHIFRETRIPPSDPHYSFITLVADATVFDGGDGRCVYCSLVYPAIGHDLRLLRLEDTVNIAQFEREDGTLEPLIIMVDSGYQDAVVPQLYTPYKKTKLHLSAHHR